MCWRHRSAAVSPTPSGDDRSRALPLSHRSLDSLLKGSLIERLRQAVQIGTRVNGKLRIPGAQEMTVPGRSTTTASASCRPVMTGIA